MRLPLYMLAAAALAGPVWATKTPVTIKPGDYKMEWQEQVPYTYCFVSRARDFRKMTSEEIDKCPGLVSKDARVVDGPLRLIVDESKGTETGFDTLYYVPAGAQPDTPDFTKAIKINVNQSNGDPIALKPVSFPKTLDWIIGEGKHRLIKKVTFEYLRAIFVYANEDKSRRVTLGALTLSGGRFGKVDTDRGPLLMILSDSDGLYGEKVSQDPETGDMNAGDVITIGEKEYIAPYRSRSMHSMYPGRDAVSYDGKLYATTVTPDGETVSIKPYEGDTGRLEIEAVDSRGNPTECFGTYATTKESIYAIHGCFGSDLPVGTYQITRFLIGPDPLNEIDGKFRFYQYRDCKVTVEKGKTSTFKVGGQITLDVRFGSETKMPAVKRGQTLDISVMPMIGEDRVEPSGDLPVSIVIKDSGGRTVHTGSAKLIFYDTDYRIFEYSLQVPREWKPGLYKLTATYPAKPYQDLITGTRMINVTQ